jgi:hypothetical protein
LLEAGRKQEAIEVIGEIIEMKPPRVNDYRRLLLGLRDTTESEVAQ